MSKIQERNFMVRYALDIPSKPSSREEQGALPVTLSIHTSGRLFNAKLTLRPSLLSARMARSFDYSRRVRDRLFNITEWDYDAAPPLQLFPRLYSVLQFSLF